MHLIYVRNKCSCLYADWWCKMTLMLQSVFLKLFFMNKFCFNNLLPSPLKLNTLKHFHISETAKIYRRNLISNGNLDSVNWFVPCIEQPQLQVQLILLLHGYSTWWISANSEVSIRILKLESNKKGFGR